MFVWTIEAVLLGLWGLGLVHAYWTAFHFWFVVCQLSVSISTFVLYYLMVALNQTKRFAGSVAICHMCAMVGLLVIYVCVVLDTSLWEASFQSSVIGLVPATAAIGLSWIAVVVFSGTCMSLSFELQKQHEAADSSMPLLVFHVYANQLCVFHPMLIVMYMYNSWLPIPCFVASMVVDVLYMYFYRLRYVYLGMRTALAAIVLLFFLLTVNWKQRIMGFVVMAVFAISLLVEIANGSGKSKSQKETEETTINPISIDPTSSNITVVSPATGGESDSSTSATKTMASSEYSLKNFNRFIKMSSPAFLDSDTSAKYKRLV
jgi:hypothetical protein